MRTKGIHRVNRSRMGDSKIGVISGQIALWNGNPKNDAFKIWGHVGMVVTIKGVTENHYNIADPDGVLEPIFATKRLIDEVSVKWKQLR